MKTELNKEEQVIKMRNTSQLLDLWCYIIISDIIIIIIIKGSDVSGGCGGGDGGRSSVMF